ncbi:S-adenosyl-L-methionine-dependent methyltransferase [Coemansia reversa NRRL 1564]|uniref:S-adenosyl-L-methionine-dependent methyltransferase n=1 Tax=Coemansia reversa (strain ATCC 12441 / NRRL 1564) TaxID=763665 RepID=A0A2G5B4Q6_COERN|nr:S-adenosyl-L-methionine-dependent methyltransferase [Coemansia reversa NRRL 1564]|eukprot:PIA13986.1 S-adenosyl-L-methionine-dependent methyltransferase [Coemansia reversa NRRL 1564]
MKLKQLEGYLGEVASFKDPKIQLEQYPTTAHLASRVLYTAETAYGDISDKAVVDLGCGCGMLSIAAAMMGASSVVGIDIDSDALAAAQDNMGALEVEDTVELVRADLCHRPADSDALELNQQQFSGMRQKFDTAVLNPPFGTKPGNKGIDVLFLQAACLMARDAVYSLHKSSTREHLIKKVQSWGYECEVLAELKFDIPMMYKFHKKKTVDVQVDLLRIVLRGAS